MREIKFRAWDNEEQKMLYEMYVHCDGMPVNKIFTDNWDYTKTLKKNTIHKKDAKQGRNTQD